MAISWRPHLIFAEGEPAILKRKEDKK